MCLKVNSANKVVEVTQNGNKVFAGDEHVDVLDPDAFIVDCSQKNPS